MVRTMKHDELVKVINDIKEENRKLDRIVEYDPKRRPGYIGIPDNVTVSKYRYEYIREVK